jgi:ABC-type lipoprotein export system ATPase subunit
VIRVSGLHKSYRDGDTLNHVLRGVDLVIASGDLVALMGPSGSGKTTLLNIMGGLDQDYQGSVTVAGQTLAGLDDAALSSFRNRSVSFVFQHFHLIPHLPVVDNVSMPSWFDRKRAGTDLRQQAMEVLGRVGLSHKAKTTPNRLSGGEKQRVAIARALFNRPRILLCDEPTGALDAPNGDRVLATFAELNREDGITIVVVTHDPQVAAKCRRTIQVADGRATEGESA